MAIPRPYVPPKLRSFIEGLGRYQSLALLAVPTSRVEPLKLVAVAVAGDGHWITGTVMIIIAYATGLLLVERLFSIVKPKLLMLAWFARLCVWSSRLVASSFGSFVRLESDKFGLPGGLPTFENLASHVRGCPFFGQGQHGDATFRTSRAWLRRPQP